MINRRMNTSRLGWEAIEPKYITPSLDYVLATQLPKSEIEDTWMPKDILYLQWNTPFEENSLSSCSNVDPSLVRVFSLGTLGPSTLSDKPSRKKFSNIKVATPVYRAQTKCWRCAWVRSVQANLSYPRSPYIPTTCWEHDD